MIRRKRFRQKGKARLSEAFQRFKRGDRVALVAVPGATPLPPQFRGKTGTVVGNTGKAFIVRFLNGKVVKKVTVKSAYLKKLKS